MRVLNFFFRFPAYFTPIDWSIGFYEGTWGCTNSLCDLTGPTFAPVLVELSDECQYDDYGREFSTDLNESSEKTIPLLDVIDSLAVGIKDAVGLLCTSKLIRLARNLCKPYNLSLEGFLLVSFVIA